MRLFLLGTLGILAMGMALTSVAQAAEWTIAGKPLSEFESKKETVTISGGPVQLTVPSLEATLECKGVKGGESSILAGGSDQLTAELTACKVVGAPSCEVTEPVVFKAKSELIKVGGAYYAKLEPGKAGEPFTTLVTKKCSLPETAKVVGAIAAAVALEELIKQPLGFSSAISKKVNEGLKAEGKSELSLLLGTYASTLQADFAISLSGLGIGNVFRRIGP